MKHVFNRINLSLVIPRQAVTNNWNHVQISNTLVDNRVHYSNKGIPIVCPLYTYPDSTTQQSLELSLKRTPNLNMTIVQEIAKKLNLIFTLEKETTPDTFAPIDILDYIYAVLHSPSYRANYKEFLKIDFPRVPYPDTPEMFWKLDSFGGELRRLHLLESVTMDSIITSYPEEGENTVTRKISAKDWDLNDPANSEGRVWINDTQYFDQVPLVAWEFYIGGYQPAQKWLKDRHGRMLSIDDLVHYQKIIVALTETDRIMKAIDVEIALVEKITTYESQEEEAI
jgi:predicted helicase